MTGAPEHAAPKKRRPRCPICGKPRVIKHKPFCSERCANIDLARWLGGSYRIPVTTEEPHDGDDAERTYDPYAEEDD